MSEVVVGLTDYLLTLECADRAVRFDRHRYCGGNPEVGLVSPSDSFQSQCDVSSRSGDRAFSDISRRDLSCTGTLTGSGKPVMKKLFLSSALVALLFALVGPGLPQTPRPGQSVNDVHSRLNETRVNRIVAPLTVQEVQGIVQQAREEGRAISIAGGRHAMGGQQFGTDTILLDTSKFNRVVA